MPGDKSISHRCVMLGAIADGDDSGQRDCSKARTCSPPWRRSGRWAWKSTDPSTARPSFAGWDGTDCARPRRTIDLGNSGTAMRLLAGLLAGQRFDCTLAGDASLGRRPMRRITEPLSRMGARIETAHGGTPAADGFAPCDGLAPIDYTSPVASAQVKSVHSAGGALRERADLRDGAGADARPHGAHARRLSASRSHVTDSGRCVEGGAQPAATVIEVPGDISSAAFFVAAAAGRIGSDLLVRGVGMNPTRTGVLTILERMGADISRLESAPSRRRAGCGPPGARHATARDRRRPRAGAAGDRRVPGRLRRRGEPPAASPASPAPRNCG